MNSTIIPVLADVSVSQYGSKQRRKIRHKYKRMIDGCSLAVTEFQLPSQVNDKDC